MEQLQHNTETQQIKILVSLLLIVKSKEVAESFWAELGENIQELYIPNVILILLLIQKVGLIGINHLGASKTRDF